MSGKLLVCAPLRVEARALQRTLARDTVLRTGYGLRRSARRAATIADRDRAAVAVAGLCGAVTDEISSGDVVVATEIRGSNGTVSCPSAPLLAGQLRCAGCTVHCGPIASTDHLVRSAEHDELARSGVLAVDMESAALADAAGSRPRAVVRVVVDTPRASLGEWGTPGRALRALRRLGTVGPVLQQWADAVASRRVLLPTPRSFCADVERAIEIVERAGPGSEGICYATTNRQHALLDVVEATELVLVAGSGNSSNSRRLVETARSRGVRAHLVEDVSDVRLDWLAGIATVAITAGASAPPFLVDELLAALGGLGALDVTEHRLTTESIQFALPKEVS